MDITSKAPGELSLRLETCFWKIETSGCETETDRTREKPVSLERVVRLWWKSLLCSRPKSLTLLFGLCPSSLLRKVPRCAASFLMSSAPVVFGEFTLLDALDKDWDKTRQLKNAIRMGDSVFYHVDTSLFSSMFDVDSIGLTSRQ